MAKKSKRGKSGAGIRVKRNSNLSIRQIDTDWMMEEVIDYNTRGKRVSVEILVPIALEERKRLFAIHTLNLANERSDDDYKPQWPPGKDKMQEIVRRWDERGVAKNSMKYGIVLKDKAGSKSQPRKQKTELLRLIERIGELSRLRKYKKKDFLRHHVIKQSLVALPTGYWLSVRNKSPHVFEMLVSIVRAMVGEGGTIAGMDVGHGLSQLLRKQGKNWRKDDFRDICSKAELIASGTGTEEQVAGWNKTLKLYLPTT
jgi:hypothetical protein